MNEVGSTRGSLMLLRERWWAVIIPILLGAAIAYGVARSEPAVYQAEANIYFKQTSFDQLLFGRTVFNQAPTTPTAAINTEMRLLGEPTVAQAVISRLRLHLTPAALRKRILIAEQADSNVVTLAAKDSNPVRAAQIANAWVDSFLLLEQSANRQPLAAAADSLRAQLAALPRGTGASGTRQALQARLGDIDLLTQLQTAQAQVALRATPPASPIAPRPLRDGVIGGVVGLGFGLMLAFVAAFFDRRIKSLDDAEASYGLPVIATVPRHRDADGRASVSWRATEEGFRMLRSQLSFSNLGRATPIKTVLVASAESGDGKSTVCAGLGFAAASAGQRVICADCDLRRPSLPARLACESSPHGLIDALFGQEPFSSVLIDVAVPTSRAQSLPSGQRPGSLKLLPVGTLPPNPAELVASEPFRARVRELADDPNVDLLLLDSPPLTAVADAAVLAPMCDAVVLVVHQNRSTAQAAKAIMAMLQRVGTPIIGLVLVGVGGPHGGYAYYHSGPTSNGRGDSIGTASKAGSDWLAAPQRAES